ncbi:UNVERIFIED_CONTAM: hypothetical protein Sindi_3096200 [Sesamum indicum]
MTPDEDGGETPCKVDVEYEWLPPKCTTCMTLGHTVKECAINKSQKPTKRPITVYVPKTNVPPTILPEKEREKPKATEPKPTKSEVHVKRNVSNNEDRGKAIILYNAFDTLHLIDDADKTSRGPNTCNPDGGLNKRDHQLALKDLVSEYRLHFLGILETRVRLNNIIHIQSFLMPQWKWFADYDTVGNRICLAWDENLIDVNILSMGEQFIHCRVTNRADDEPVFITVTYGASEYTNIPWLVGGDFNAVRDLNEDGHDEFNTDIQEGRLMPLPIQGEWFLINDRWLAKFPMSFYHSLTPRISDHSPLVIHGDTQQQHGGMFQFDNYLALSSDFIPSMQNIWQHKMVGVPMFAVTRKMKALKPIFRTLKRNKGDLTLNVHLAKGFLDEAQNLVSSDRQNELYLCWSTAQRAKMQWMKDEDQCSKVFFRKIAQRRVTSRILQINDENGTTHTKQREVALEFLSYYQNLLGGTRRRVSIDIRYLRLWARHIITDEEAAHLLLPFSPDDVKQAVFDIAEDNAPGPDGFSSGFFKAAWLVAAFILRRSIGDNIMLAQELFTGYNQLRLPPRCAMKVDIRKAYDTVECDFLLAVCNYLTFQQYSSNGLRSVLPRPHFRLDSMENLTGSLLGRKDYDKEILYLPTFLYLLWKCYIWDFYNLLNKICSSPTTRSVSLQDTS